jgi:hypothetical protein
LEGRAHKDSEPGDKTVEAARITAADLDGNFIRVFYDFRCDV